MYTLSSLQTGSDKTHAMSSGVHSGRTPGLIQMSVAEQSRNSYIYTHIYIYIYT